MRVQDAHVAREPRDFSKRGDALPVPNLVEVQQESYQRFLQKEVAIEKRKNDGLESLLREVFPRFSTLRRLRKVRPCGPSSRRSSPGAGRA